MPEISELIKSRKSVRSFDGNPLHPEDRDRLEQYMGTIVNPFGVPVRFVLLDAKEHGLSSPVLAGETLYAAGMVEKGPDADVAFGFSFEKLVLYAWSLGIGTTWIGGTMKRELFEKAAGLRTNEMMPCVTPLGYPAKKRSVKETLMRKGAGADGRMSTEKLFFDGTWGVPLLLSGQDGLKELAEMVRWAPSAVNRQPWRIIRKDGVFHFYEKKDKGYVSDKTGDLQRVDLGIALCHFMSGMESLGKTPVFTISDPGVTVPDGVFYIASVREGASA